MAHRYSYVPPLELGGDGERSITWLEVDAAKRAGKPVFAFVVDPAAPWAEVKEQGRLVSEPENAAEIKDYLGRECTLATFTSPEHLAEGVVIALANFHVYAAVGDLTAHSWKPILGRALQLARRLRGPRGEAPGSEELAAIPPSPRTMPWGKAPTALAGTPRAARARSG